MRDKTEQSQTPDGWRELLSHAVREPTLPEDAQGGSRRQRRRARKEATNAQRRRTRAALNAERLREPVTAGGAALIIVAFLALGVAAHWFTGNDEAQPRTAPTAHPAPLPPATTSPPPNATGSPSPPGGEPVLSDPEQVAHDWATAYLTRNPPEDGDHTASVDRASKWMTTALARNLAASADPKFDELVSHGGVSEVTTVTVGAADRGLGTDTPLRIWRQLKITVEVDGNTDYTDTLTLQGELTRQAGERWFVSRVRGL